MHDPLIGGKHGNGVCWGFWVDPRNVLGPVTHTTPVALAGFTKEVTAIAVYGNTCVLTSGGGVKCGGDNTYGQLGDGTTARRTRFVDIIGLTSGVAAIAAGGNYSCAITSVGAVKCWGDNGQGQLGDGSTIQSSTPVDVVGLTSGVTAITMGDGHACALMSTGDAKCWGGGGAGRLGNGARTDSTTPVEVLFSIP